MVLGMEPRALGMLGKCPTTLATSLCILDQALVMPYREAEGTMGHRRVSLKAHAWCRKDP